MNINIIIVDSSVPGTYHQTSLMNPSNVNAFIQIQNGQSQMQAENNAKVRKRKQLSIATYIPKKLTINIKKKI